MAKKSKTAHKPIEDAAPVVEETPPKLPLVVWSGDPPRLEPIYTNYVLIHASSVEVRMDFGIIGSDKDKNGDLVADPQTCIFMSPIIATYLWEMLGKQLDKASALALRG